MTIVRRTKESHLRSLWRPPLTGFEKTKCFRHKSYSNNLLWSKSIFWVSTLPVIKFSFKKIEPMLFGFDYNPRSKFHHGTTFTWESDRGQCPGLYKISENEELDLPDGVLSIWHRWKWGIWINWINWIFYFLVKLNHGWKCTPHTLSSVASNFNIGKFHEIIRFECFSIGQICMYWIWLFS